MAKKKRQRHGNATGSTRVEGVSSVRARAERVDVRVERPDGTSVIFEMKSRPFVEPDELAALNQRLLTAGG